MLSGDAGSQFRAMVEGMVASGNIQTPEQVRGRWRLELVAASGNIAGEGKVEVGGCGSIRKHSR